MIVTRHNTVEIELLHWLVVLIVAIGILLLLASTVFADPMGAQIIPRNTTPPPGPMARPFFPESPPLPPDVAQKTVESLQMILDHQRGGSYAEALAGWEEIYMPAETAVWREIAMGSALLAMEDYPQALRRLELAESISPHHPLVAYFRGLVWMRQAERLGLSVGEANAAVATPEVQKAVFELMAIEDFREAIERAELIDPSEPLVTVAAMDLPLVASPQVGELLEALGAENFVADAQRHLFDLHVRRREWSDAERHLQVAIEAGAADTSDMQKLANAMLEGGNPRDALRIMWRVVKLDYPRAEDFSRSVWRRLARSTSAGFVW